MARGLNKVMLIGNLGRDAETRFTPNGTSVTNFSVATSRRLKDGQTGEWRDETDWHDIVLWKAENLAQYLTKGTQVYVEGRLQTRSWEDQNGQKRYRTEVVADPFGVMLLSGRGDSQGGGGGDFEPRRPAQHGAAAGGAGSGGASDADDMGVTDDDVPF